MTDTSIGDGIGEQWQPAPAGQPGTELAVFGPRDLENLLGVQVIDIRSWAESLVHGAEFPESDPDDATDTMLTGILMASSSQEAFAAMQLQRAKEMCGGEPGGRSNAQEVRGVLPFKSTFEQGAPCYIVVSSFDLAESRSIRWTTGAKAVQTVILTHYVRGWWPFRMQLAIRGERTKRGFYPLNAEPV
jgi:hypothetical protein